MTLNAQPSQTQSLYPYRENFLPTPRQGEVSPVPVDIPAVAFTGSTAEVADASIRYAADAFALLLGRINVPMLSADGVAAQIAAFQDTDAMTAATAAAKAVTDEAQAAHQKVADLQAGVTDTDGDTATALAAQAYWQRKARLLDSIASGPLLMSAAQGLIADANNPELAVLASELPDYLKSRQAADTSWVSVALAPRIPGVADAIDDANAKAKANAVTIWNFKQLMNRVENTTTPNGYRGPTFSPLPS